jgi:hypothetical protein
VRIAVSGTHCSGKTTLIESFLAAHRDYVHEPEPYEWLTEVHGEAMGEELAVDDFYRQLEFSADRLRNFGPDAKVIAERCPLDFLAYILALVDLDRAARDCELIASAAELTAAGMAHIDLLVVLSMDDIAAPASEDPELRSAMNERLLDLVTADEYSVLKRTRIVEIRGGPQERLRLLERAL